MAKLSSLQVDTDKSSGIWREYEAGIEVCIARFGDSRVQRFIENEQRKRRADLGRANSERARKAGIEILNLALSHKIITGWRNLEDDDGNPIECSVEEKVRICEDPRYEPFLDWIVATSKDEQFYRVETEEADRGN